MSVLRKTDSHGTTQTYKKIHTRVHTSPTKWLHLKGVDETKVNSITHNRSSRIISQRVLIVAESGNLNLFQYLFIKIHDGKYDIKTVLSFGIFLQMIYSIVMLRTDIKVNERQPQNVFSYLPRKKLQFLCHFG